MRNLIRLLAFILLIPAVGNAQVTGPAYVFVAGTTANPDEVNSNFSTIYANALNRTGGTMSGLLTAQNILPDGDNTRNFGSAAASWASGWFDGTLTVATLSNTTATITTLNLTTLTCTGCVDATQLAATTVSANAYGSATAIPTFTVDADGRLTAAGTATPQLTLTSTYFSSLSAANLTGVPAAQLSGTITSATQDLITRTGTVTSGTWSGSFGAVSGANLTSLSAGNLSGTITSATQDLITRTGTLVSGATGAGFTVALATSTISGDLPDVNLSANVPLLNAASNAFTGVILTADAAASAPGFSFSGDTDAGFFRSSTSTLPTLAHGGLELFSVNSAAPNVLVNTRSMGAGAVVGPSFQVGFNNSGNGAAGTLRLMQKGGGTRIVWADTTTGILRIHSAAPTEDNTTVSDTAGSVVGSILPAATQLFLDGGGDTYLQESSANRIDVVAGASVGFFITATGSGVAAADKLWLDGGGDTYIYESSANALAFTAGGSALVWTATTLYPATDNAQSLGFTGQRYTAVWAVNGTIQTSDRANKQDIAPSDLGLDFILNLKPSQFAYRDQPNERRYGLIAQDVVAAAKGRPLHGIVTGEPGSYGMNYAALVTPLVSSVQNHEARIAALEARLASFEQRP